MTLDSSDDKTGLARALVAYACTCNRVGKRTAWILIRLRGCAGWSGSMLVANTLRWFCRDAAHLCDFINEHFVYYSPDGNYMIYSSWSDCSK
jgi:hypothetical protein